MRMRERPPGQVSETADFWSPILQMQSALVAFARGLVGDAELARDITQDAFVDAWRAALQQSPPFVDGDATGDLIGIRRWLFTVTYRHAIKYLRRRQRIAWESLEAREAATPVVLRVAQHFEDAFAESEALAIALRSVEPEDAACVLLQVVYGFSTAEIATMLDLRPDAVRKRLSRAKKRLRDAYLALSQPSETHEGESR